MNRFVLLMLAGAGVAGAAELRPLFDGASTNGWVLRGGHAQFRIEDGCLVGVTVTGQPNSFLCPPGEYGDFVLEYEYKVDPKLNSGVQIRSQCFETPVELQHAGKVIKVPARRVHGYQVEIDNDPGRARFWSAGIYEEGARGWIYPGFGGGDGAAFTAQGKRLTKVDGWNHVRVECRGDHIRTWLNGELRADVRDGRVARGFIGFQVHSHKEGGLEVRWRNIRIAELP